jgi:hypothetical protein
MEKRYYRYSQWESDEHCPTDVFKVEIDTSGLLFPERAYPSAKELILKLIHEYPNYEKLVYATRVDFNFNNVDTVMSSMYVHSTINSRLISQLSNNAFKLFSYGQIVKLINNGNGRTI